MENEQGGSTLGKVAPEEKPKTRGEMNPGGGEGWPRKTRGDWGESKGGPILVTNGGGG